MPSTRQSLPVIRAVQRLTSLPPGHVLVFGSNRRGIHGAGAARDAERFFGAVRGVGEGLRGQSYALPTKDENIKTLPIVEIAVHASRFLAFAESRPDLMFILTPVGCGLAGYTPAEIAPLFASAPENVRLPEVFSARKNGRRECPMGS